MHLLTYLLTFLAIKSRTRTSIIKQYNLIPAKRAALLYGREGNGMG